MKPWLRPLIWMLVLLVLGGGTYWVAQNTYWAEEPTRTARRGAALTDQNYVLRQWLQAQGSSLTVVAQLDPLPPKGTTLVLGSDLWDMQQQRLQAVQQWVAQGGHLVVMANVLVDRTAEDPPDPLLAWLGLKLERPWEIRHRQKVAANHRNKAASVPSDGDDEEHEDDEGTGNHNTDTPSVADDRVLRDVINPREKVKCNWSITEPEPGTEPGSANLGPDYAAHFTSHFPGLRTYALCTETTGVLRITQAPRWGLQDALGWRVLRLPVGQGQVTVSTQYLLPNDASELERDHPALMAATLDLHAGDAVWLAETEAMPVLPLWLWQVAPATCALLLLAAATALWRAVPRFGPLRQPAPDRRRSLTAQVEGTAAFLLHQRSPLLLQVQLRALRETWTRHGTASPAIAVAATWPELARTIAHAAGLEAAALTAAGNPTTKPRTVRQLLHDLRLLETARRRILAAPRAPTSTGPQP